MKFYLYTLNNDLCPFFHGSLSSQVMTTNHPEKLDPALIRPGRINKRIHLGFVDAETLLKSLRSRFGESWIGRYRYMIYDTRWWFQLCFMLIPIGGNAPNWPAYFSIGLKHQLWYIYIYIYIPGTLSWPFVLLGVEVRPSFLEASMGFNLQSFR